MQIIAFFINRKVTVAMIYVLVVLLGIIAWNKLPKEFMPNLEFPQLTVITSYSHASSKEVENLVTKSIEEACAVVRGVRRMRSISREGVSFVTVEFMWGTDMDFASLNLREKIDIAKAKLPSDCNDPRIERFNPFAMPVLILSLSGNRTSEDLLEFAKKPVAEIFEKITGVAQVSLMGGREREIRVELDKERLDAHGVSILDVADAVKHTNITFPAGSVKDKVFEYTVRIVGVFKNIADIRNVSIMLKQSDKTPSRTHKNEMNLKSASKKDRMVTIDMLGRAIDDYKEVSSYSRYDSKENISISILKQGDAYIVDVAESCKNKLEQIKKRLPKDIKLEIVYDQSKYIKDSISDLISNGVFGAVLAFIVILLFLKNIKDAAIVSVSIPLSILAALFLLYVTGVTINTISMAGLILGIGQLVDASIVVQENIARHRKTKGIVEASILGAKEVMGSVTGSILTTIVVFFPLIFVQGIIGQVFYDLSLAIVFSLGASLIVAFTIVPMLASLPSVSVSKKEGLISGKQYSKFNDISGKLTSMIITQYRKVLFYCFNNSKRVIVGFCIVSLLFLVILLFFVPKELFPKVSTTQFMVKIDLPVGTKLEVTDRVARIVEEILFNRKEVESCSVTVGSLAKEGIQLLGKHQAQIVAQIHRKHKKALDSIIKDIRLVLMISENKTKDYDERLLASLEGASITIERQSGTFSVISQGGVPGHNKPIVIEIKGHELDSMTDAANIIKTQLHKTQGITDIGTSISVPGPEIEINVNKQKLATYNLTVVKLAKTILTAVKGKVVSRFREEGKEIDIRVGMRKEDTENIEKIGELLISSPLGIDIPLDAVADIKRAEGPSEIMRIDQERTIIVSASRDKISLEEARINVNKILEQLDYPYLSIELAGESRAVKESNKSLQIILILAMLFVYMVMASEFESLWQPFLILFTIPMSLIGIVPGLLLTGHKLSIMSGMGVVLVGGLVVNNGIVLIDFINQWREDNKDLCIKDVIYQASITRLRPILMTAFTAILGLLPLALNLGGDADMQVPMAIVVIFGLFAATFLTLIVLPLLYYASIRRSKLLIAGRGL